MGSVKLLCAALTGQKMNPAVGLSLLEIVSLLHKKNCSQMYLALIPLFSQLEDTCSAHVNKPFT